MIKNHYLETIRNLREEIEREEDAEFEVESRNKIKQDRWLRQFIQFCKRINSCKRSDPSGQTDEQLAEDFIQNDEVSFVFSTGIKNGLECLMKMTAAEKKSRISQKKRLGQPAGRPRRVASLRRRKKKT